MEEVDDYERQSDLLERFLSNNDKTAFKKLLNMNLTTDKEKEPVAKQPKFLKSMKNRKPTRYYQRMQFHNDDNLFNRYTNDNNYSPGEINKFKIDFHNIIQDPEYKDKCLKGNYKWGSMKFQQIKINLAKRKGVSIDDFQMPKIANRQSKQMEMNGQLIMGSNHLAASFKIKKTNTLKIRNSIKDKPKTSEMPGYSRQMSQQIPSEISPLEIKI